VNDVVNTYFEAWTTGDLETAMKCVAPDVVAHGPAGKIEGAEGFRAFVGNFAGRLTGVRLLRALSDAEGAVLFYETDTDVAQGALAAESLTVRDGLIVEAWYAFDRLPFVPNR
jgi:ketosteroid isomerase-like protein